jgi:predicted pyridoxine 5'-phosphate oxidase superfamily flavin-nucleotide-binding protein
MVTLPDEVIEGWKAMQGPAILTTVDADGIPNSVYVNNITLFKDTSIGIADGAFSKTRQNILNGSTASFLFLSPSAAYQIKGSFEYHTQGPVLENARDWANFKFPVLAIAVVKPEIVFNGSRQVV